jgi:hypothetical protein
MTAFRPHFAELRALCVAGLSSVARRSYRAAPVGTKPSLKVRAAKKNRSCCKRSAAGKAVILKASASCESSRGKAPATQLNSLAGVA